MRSDDSGVVRAYRALLRLMPRRVWSEDEGEITQTFAVLWSEERSARGRAVVMMHAFGGLLVALALEWWDVIRRAETRAGVNRRRRGKDGIGRMVAYSARSLRKNPAFAWSVVLLLGLGVGSVTTMFTLVDHVLLRPLPYPMADRLFYVENGSHSGPLFEDLQQFRSVEEWAAVTMDDANLTGVGRPQRFRQARISRGFYPMFAARPTLGRLLVADDFRTGDGVVLSHGTWQRVFGGDPAVIGRDIVIDGTPSIVIGVLDATFVPPVALVGGQPVDVWRPIDRTAEWYSRRGAWMLNVAGRLREGTALAVASSEADDLAERRAREYPDQYVDRDGNVVTLPLATLQAATVGGVRLGLGLLLGAVTLLLLVACTNVALLFMARGLARVRELAVRRALGANTRSIVAQLLCESLLVAVGGAALGVLLAVLGLRGFLVLSPEVLPRAEAITIDPRILAFALGLAAATAILFGLLPALRLAGQDVAGALHGRERGSTDAHKTSRVQAGLVLAEVALSLVLVTQAGSLLRSFTLLHGQDFGFRTENIWTLPLNLTGIESGEEYVRRMEAVRASLVATPGVRAATFGLSMPLEFTGGGRCCWSVLAEQWGMASSSGMMVHPIEATYFDIFRLRFIAGAPWSRSEQDARPRPAVVTEPLAIEAFGSAREALGQEMGDDDLRFRIVGVVADDRHYGPDQRQGSAAYVPITTATWWARAHTAVLVDRADAGLGDRLRDAVWRAEPDLPVPTVRALEDWARDATARMRFESLLFTTFGAVALLLVAGGLSGTLLYTVGRRRRELGIRLALGDVPARLARRVLWLGVRIVAVGCTIGVAGAWAFGRLLESRLFGVEPGDPLTTVGAVIVVLIVTFAAGWLPARSAANTDPMEALRSE